MSRQLTQLDVGRLERSCSRDHDDWVRISDGSEGIERVEAFFQAQAFAPHRHDTYAIGRTISGVQTFNYRGSQRYSLPGQILVLHPDERHDGGPGTDGGFRYRILYVDPALIQLSLGGRPLPFVVDPIPDHQAIREVLHPIFQDFAGPMDALQATDIVTTVAEALMAAVGQERTGRVLDVNAVARARDYLCGHLDKPASLDDLERETGLDRWRLARQFRRAYGTSPYRFLTMRRLDRARALLLEGQAIADVAASVGFADQSHLSRHFKRAYGVPPGRWLGLIAARDGRADSRALAPVVGHTSPVGRG